MARPTRVLGVVLIDDHAFMRELLAKALARQASRFKILGQGGSAAEALHLCRKALPDLLILDIHLPDEDGIAIVPALKKASPKTKVLLCSAYASEDCMTEAIQSGAEGFVEKTKSWKDFLVAVERVVSGERFFRSSAGTPLPGGGQSRVGGPETPRLPLSPREREILTLIARGSTSKEIANTLHLSVQTVDTHRANLMSKLHLRNVAGLVLYAVQKGLVPLPRADSFASRRDSE